MSSLSISAAWDETRSILARDGQLYAAVALALIVLPEVILAVVGAPLNLQGAPVSLITFVAVFLLGLVAHLAMNRLAIGPSVTVGAAISRGFARLLPVAVVVAALLALVMLVSIVLLMVLGGTGLVRIPGPGQPPPASLLVMLMILLALAAAIFQLVLPVAAVETANPIRLVTRSWHLARHHYGRLLAFIGIAFVAFSLVVLALQVSLGSVLVLALGAPHPGSISALVLGLIAGLVQAGFTMALATMLARIYLQLAGRDGPQASVPSSGT